MPHKPISRRNIVRQACAAGAVGLIPGPAAAAAPVFAGAIRWDAWETTDRGIANAVAATLGPHQYNNRAPFCATSPAADTIDMSSCDTQAAMDEEIADAARAGLAYWAYCWYGAGDPMMNAWALHQSSVLRNQVGWCLLLQFSRLGGAGAFAAVQTAFVGYFQQPNYQKLAGARPLIYLYVDQIAHLASDWGGNWANVGTALDHLATACASAGLARPYIVVMFGAPKDARAIASALSADAISNYMARTPKGQPATYRALDASAQAYWAEMAATGGAIVPICMTGWDTRPRKLHPPPWQHGQAPNTGMDTYVAAGTPAEIAAHIRAAIDYINAHPAITPARTLLVYSWNECDEGGSPLVPTYTPAGADHAILDAVGAVLRRA